MRNSIFTLLVAFFTHFPVVAQDPPAQNLPPQVSFVYPTSTVTLFSLSDAVPIRATATDADGVVREVRLLVNGIPVAADFLPPFEFTFKPAAPTAFANYSLQLEAVDLLGGSGLSQTRLVQYVRIFDHLTNNITLSTGTNLVLHSSNVDATHQKGEPQHAGVPGGKSVWFAWRATAAGTVVMDTEGSNFDTVLAVYTNRSLGLITSPTNLVEVAANDDDSAIAPLSRVKFTAFANITYLIAVDGKQGFAGDVRLTIRQQRTTTAPNDFLANATRISLGTPAPVSSVGATKERDEPDHAGNTGGASMWFRVDLPRGVPVRISTTNSNFDTLLAVYTNSSVVFQPSTPPVMEELRLVAANDDAEGTNRTSEVRFVTGNTPSYWIAVDGYNGAEGTIRLNIAPQSTQSGVPPNDRFINAAILVGSSVLTNANTLSATTEFGEPTQQSSRYGGKSVWYRWVAPRSGPVYLSTEWSEFDTMLGVYLGASITNLIPVAFNDDADGLRTSALVFDAVEGEEYRIAVAGYLGAGGEMVLMLNQPRVTLPQMITLWNGVKFTLSVISGSDRMLLEASSDLAEWRPVRWVSPGELIEDIEPSIERPREFYRVVSLE